MMAQERIEIAYNEFITKLNDAKQYYPIRDLILNQNIDFKPAPGKPIYLDFINCEFKSMFKIGHSTAHTEIKFINCEFKAGLSIEELHTTNTNSSSIELIKIEDCQITGALNIKKIRSNKGILIKNSIISSISLTDVVIEESQKYITPNITISNINKLNNLILKDVKNEKDTINIDNLNITDSLYLENLLCSALKIEKNEVGNELKIIGNCVNSNISLLNNKFGTVLLQSLNAKNFIFDNCDVKNTFTTSITLSNFFELKESEISKGLTISNIKAHSCNITSNSFRSFITFGTIELENNLKFEKILSVEKQI